MINWSVLLLATALAPPIESSPGFLDGAFLHTVCHAEPIVEEAELRNGFCLGYILGVADEALREEAALPPVARTICLPIEVLAEDLRAAVDDVLENHPQSQGAAAASVVSAALAHTFPCRPDR